MIPFVQAARIDELQALLHRLRRDQFRQRDHGHGLLHSVRVLGLQNVSAAINGEFRFSGGATQCRRNGKTHQTYTNILEGRMIQLPRRAVALPLIIHRRQHLETRASLELLPDPATSTRVALFLFFQACLAERLYTNS